MSSSFFRLLKPGKQRQLICFHHAGGNAAFFLPWKNGIADETAIYAVQLPGHGTRINETLLTSINQMANEIVSEYHLLPARETLFFGHSMGAILAFEVALRLQKKNLINFSLCVSGRLPPHLNTGTNFYQQEDSVLLERIISLSEGLNNSEQTELLSFLLPTFRADFEAIECYEFSGDEKLNCPIIALVGDSDSEVSVSQMREWQKVTTNTLILKTFPGGHFYLNKQLPYLLDFLNSVLLDFCGESNEK